MTEYINFRIVRRTIGKGKMRREYIVRISDVVIDGKLQGYTKVHSSVDAT